MPQFETLLAFDFREVNHKGKTVVGFPHFLPLERETTAHLGKNNEHARKIHSVSMRVEVVKYFDPNQAGNEKTAFWQDGPGARPLRQDLLFGLQKLTAVKFPAQDYSKSIAAKISKLFIVEGQWDAMCLWELGYSAVSVLSAGQKDIAPELFTLLSDSPRIFLLMDNDEAGRQCRERLAEKLPTQTVYVNYPGETKDMCQLMEQYKLDFVDSAISKILELPLAKPRPKQKPNPNEPAPEFTLGVIKASAVVPEEVTWLWDYRVPLGMLTVFCGNPDVGKSTVVAAIVAAATKGAGWPDCENKNKPCDVLMAIGEDSPSQTVVPRLMAAGANLDRVEFMENTLRYKDKKKSERLLALDTDVVYIKRHVQANPEIRLIVFDPLTGYLGQARKNNEQDVRQVLTQLKDLAESTGVAVLSLDHFNKNLEQAAIHRISGSQALIAVPRVAWGFAKDDEDESGEKRLMSNIKGNIIPENKKHGLNYRIVGKDVPGASDIGVVEWLGRTTVTMDQALSGAPKTRAASAWLKDLLSDGEKLSREVYSAAKDAGHTEATLRIALKQLKVVSDKKPDGWWMSLP